VHSSAEADRRNKKHPFLVKRHFVSHRPSPLPLPAIVDPVSLELTIDLVSHDLQSPTTTAPTLINRTHSVSD
jgi:hypothetical protein